MDKNIKKLTMTTSITTTTITNLDEKSSGELIKLKIDWPDWYTHRLTDKDRQTDTCTSINIHCCTQTPENLIVKD